MSFQNYFIYKDKVYGIGTKVKLKSTARFDIIGSMSTKITNINDVKNVAYTFKGGSTDGHFIFWWQEIDNNLYMKYGIKSQVTVLNPEEDIEEIVEPIEVQLVSWQQNAIQNMFDGKTITDVFGGILIYIVVMCVGAIFKGSWMIWIVATAIFIWWLLNQYKN
jgi:hypothetical protein